MRHISNQQNAELTKIHIHTVYAQNAAITAHAATTPTQYRAVSLHYPAQKHVILNKHFPPTQPFCLQEAMME